MTFIGISMGAGARITPLSFRATRVRVVVHTSDWLWTRSAGFASSSNAPDTLKDSFSVIIGAIMRRTIVTTPYVQTSATQTMRPLR